MKLTRIPSYIEMLGRVDDLIAETGFADDEAFAEAARLHVIRNQLMDLLASAGLKVEEKDGSYVAESASSFGDEEEEEPAKEKEASPFVRPASEGIPIMIRDEAEAEPAKAAGILPDAEKTAEAADVTYEDKTIPGVSVPKAEVVEDVTKISKDEISLLAFKIRLSSGNYVIAAYPFGSEYAVLLDRSGQKFVVMTVNGEFNVMIEGLNVTGAFDNEHKMLLFSAGEEKHVATYLADVTKSRHLSIYDGDVSVHIFPIGKRNLSDGFASYMYLFKNGQASEIRYFDGTDESNFVYIGDIKLFVNACWDEAGEYFAGIVSSKRRLPDMPDISGEEDMSGIY